MLAAYDERMATTAGPSDTRGIPRPSRIPTLANRWGNVLCFLIIM